MRVVRWILGQRVPRSRQTTVTGDEAEQLIVIFSGTRPKSLR